MQLRSRLFQYPVLSPYSDDYSNETFELLIDEVLTEDGMLILQVKFELSELAIQNQIDNNNASFGVFIECPKTSFRHFYRNQSSDFSIELKFDSLNDWVRVQGYIILNEDISNYYSSNFHTLYGDNSFNVNKNSILALSQEYKIDIEPEDSAFKSVDSIFKVIKQTNLNDVEIDINYQSDYIKVYLSSNRYREYKEVEQLTKKNPEILHSILVVPILINVLLEIKDYSTEEIDFKWFESLTETLREKGINFDKTLYESNSILNLANQLLESPTLKSLEIIGNILRIKGDADEEV